MAFGSVAPPQGDVESLKVYLGCTKEVSSFEVELENWDSKYLTSPNIIAPAQDGHIDIGRGSNVPQLITCRVEDLEYQSTHAEHYLKVKGRCWGEKLFRKTVTKTYVNQKGEAIIKDLIDYYVGLSHVRNSVELIEDTDTTYTKLEYKDTPVFDILSFIADTADKSGVIGYDFRVAPDGKFEFFPRLSKTATPSLSEMIETATYRKDISRVRNKITVYGAAEKAYPTNKDDITENITESGDHTQLLWSPGGTTTAYWERWGICLLYRDNSVKIKGSYSAKCDAASGVASAAMSLKRFGSIVFNLQDYPSLNFQIRRTTNIGSYGVKVQLVDVNDQKLRKMLDKFDADKWKVFTLRCGEEYADDWTVDEFNTQAFDWTQVKEIMFEAYTGGSDTGSFWVDNFFFDHKRWSAVEEDATSQNNYGVREYVETDEELHSDEECDRRAKALLAWKKDYAEYITLSTTVLDYGTTPILAGDKIYVNLPNELVGAYFRVISAEYDVNVKSQTLTVTLELGKEAPLYADYIFALRKNERKHARYKIARI